MITLAALIVGLVVGYLLHVWIAKELGASKMVVAGWKLRIEDAISNDERTAKARLKVLVADIEKHL